MCKVTKYTFVKYQYLHCFGVHSYTLVIGLACITTGWIVWMGKRLIFTENWKYKAEELYRFYINHKFNRIHEKCKRHNFWGNHCHLYLMCTTKMFGKQAKSTDTRELRANPQHTDRFTLNVSQAGRRLSRRNQGKQRWVMNTRSLLDYKTMYNVTLRLL